MRLHATLVLGLAAALMSPVAAEEPRTPVTTLRVVSPNLPTRWAPGMAQTESDRLAMDLVFESLLAPARDSHGNRRYRPQIAERIPSGEGVERTFHLIANAEWSTGEKVTATDVRHTLRLLQQSPGATLAWRTLLTDPQSPGPRELRATFRNGVLRPETWFAFPILPQLHQGRELQRLDDADFARKPVGSGPFQVSGVHAEGKRDYLLLVANHHHRSFKRLPFTEIRWYASSDLVADLPALDPDLVLGFDAETLHQAAGKATLRITEAATSRIVYLALNHRHPGLAQLDLRHFLGHSLKPEPTVNGLVPRSSWAAAPPPRVPERMYQPDSVNTDKLVAAKQPVRLTCKIPNTDAATVRVFGEIIDHWQSTAKSRGLDLQVELQSIAPTALADALRSREYEIALTAEDAGDHFGRLLTLFDPRPEALAPGGSNFLGVQDQDLYTMLLNLPKYREFTLHRDWMHNVHAHLFRNMPLIPLRQHTAALGAGPRWAITASDPLHPFLDLLEWRKAP